MKYCLPISSLTAIFAVASLTACSDDQKYTVSGDGSLTPLSVSVSMSGASGQTRAVDHDFEANDILWAYFEHVDFSGSSQIPKTVGMSPSLVSFKVNNPVGMSQIGETSEYKTENIQVTSVMQGTQNILPQDHSVLYWDDFSSSSEPINQSTRGLRIKYGYCYNGAEPAQAVNQTTGELSWSVAKDQTEGIKKNDLLWCTGTAPVSYVHDKNNREQMAITIPYTHAMSKVTIVLTAKEGFSSSNPFKNTTASLLGMYRTGTVNAAALAESSRILSPSPGSSDEGIVDMHKKETILASATNEYVKCIFEAIVVPTRVLNLSDVIAQVTDVEGNIYNITATQAVLDAFAQSTGAESCTFKSGYNYQINVSLEKQKQTIEARITDWDNIIADNESGVIMFNPDVRDSQEATGSPADEAATFNLWYAECAGDVAGEYQGPFDIARNATLGAWNGSSLYWKDGSTKYCFRALGTYDNTKSIIKIDGENKTSAAQSVDLLWGTTSSHKGYDKDGNLVKKYDAGDPIDPRTGSVPMTFEHAMSKISVKLETTSSTSADHVSLEDAKISIINLYDGGTVNVQTGDIESLTSPLDTDPSADPRTIKDAQGSYDSENDRYNWLNNIVIPQKLNVDRVGVDRDVTPLFYNITQLTPIYPEANSLYAGTENTSIGTGTPTYYSTSELGDMIPPVLYDESGANTFNAALSGHVSLNDIKTPAVPAVPYADLAEFNTAHAHRTISEDDFQNHLSDAAKEKTPAGIYTDETAEAANTSHLTTDNQGKNPGDEDYNPTYESGWTEVHNGDSFSATYYSYSDYIALDALTQSLYDALDEQYKVKVPAVPAVYYTEQADVDAYNATLDGAVHEGDVKIPGYYKLPTPAPPLHKVGDIRESGNKIMLYITLADGTIYSLDLASCTTTVDAVEKAVDEWKRGEHYTYTITLKKDKISFRAMVKEWEEKTGSGNATLDWD